MDDPKYYRHTVYKASPKWENPKHPNPDSAEPWMDCHGDKGQPACTLNEQRRFAGIRQVGHLIDSYRMKHPIQGELGWGVEDESKPWTWRGSSGKDGDYKDAGRYYGRGMRIDYMLIHESLRHRIKRSEVLGSSADRIDFLGSDHCPILLELSPSGDKMFVEAEGEDGGNASVQSPSAKRQKTSEATTTAPTAPTAPTTTAAAAAPLNVESLNVTPVARLSLSSGGMLVVSRGSVVTMASDAIVNAANTRGLGGGGVDGAISSAGGPSLFSARKALPIVASPRVRIPVGEARCTIGGDLNATWCIHAVGPDYRTEETTLRECDVLLKSAYLSSIKIAKEKKLNTIGFSLLSAGIFRGERTVEEVLRIGVETICEFGGYKELNEVHLVGYTFKEMNVLMSLMKEKKSSMKNHHL